jgi:polyhydroxyalkanoate synthesis regulator phasin
MAKTPNDKDTIRKIWLAGIGAYGRAVTEAKGAVDTLAGKGSEVFDELVQKGEMLETVGKYKANELVGKGSELVGKGKAAVEDITPDFEIDDRIAKMRARLSGAAEKRDDRLTARVDRLEAKLDAILEKLDIGDAAPKKPATRKKAPARKRAAPKTKMTTQKTAAVKKKAPARKTAAKKPTARKAPPKKTATKK